MADPSLAPWGDKLLDELEKAFPDDSISIIYVSTRPKKNKQSLIVNDQKISFSWSPTIDEIDTEESYEALKKMCVREIKNAKNKEK